MSVPVTIPVHEAIFAFTSGLTFREYVRHLNTEHRQFLTRRYDSLRVDPESQSFLCTYPIWVYLIILVNEDAPDTMMVLPILQRLAESGPRLDLRIISDDASLLALNDLLDEDIDLEEEVTDLELPLLFFFDEEWNQLDQWGPRPRKAEQRLENWLTRNPEYDILLNEEENGNHEAFEEMLSELTHEMRLWYNDDLTGACVDEILQILKRIDLEG